MHFLFQQISIETKSVTLKEMLTEIKPSNILNKIAYVWFKNKKKSKRTVIKSNRQIDLIDDS